MGCNSGGLLALVGVMVSCYKGITTSVWSPQAPSNLLNATRHLLLGPYEGPHFHWGAQNLQQIPSTTPDTYTVGLQAIQGITPSPWSPQAPTYPPKPHQMITPRVLGLYEGTNPTL